MRTVRLLSVCIAVALAWNQARQSEAQYPVLPDPEPVKPAAQPVTHLPVTFKVDAPAAGAPATGMPTTPQAPGRPGQPDVAAPPQAAPVFAEAAPAGTEAAGGAYAPQMLGDSLAYFSRVQFNNPSPIIFTSGSQGLSVFVPVSSLAGSAFKVADNESPIPRDRCFMNIDYFAGVYHGTRPDGAPRVRITRLLFGAEKTFLDGDASIGVRVPIFQVNGDNGFSNPTELGDVTFVSKVALLRDCQSGVNVVAGLCVTVPTGTGLGVTDFSQQAPGAVGFTTVINPTIVQPWLGFYLTPSEQFYVHGFSAMAFPFDDDLGVAWFNDIGVGCYAYRGSCVSVIPTVEAHLTTGLSGRGSDHYPVGIVDAFDTILGVHLAWNDGTVLTFGYAFPWTGPQPFSSELICQLNHRF